MGEPPGRSLERCVDRAKLVTMAATSSGDGRPGRATRTAHPSTAGISFASTSGIRRKMQAQQSRDTVPELALRQAVHALSLRYRVDRAPIKGLRRRADLVFGQVKLAVYVDGCFWHVCPDHGNWPRVHEAWWRAKLERNKAGDRSTDERLREAGWTVLRVWEHEDPVVAAQRVRAMVCQLRGVKSAPKISDSPRGGRRRGADTRTDG